MVSFDYIALIIRSIVSVDMLAVLSVHGYNGGLFQILGCLILDIALNVWESRYGGMVISISSSVGASVLFTLSLTLLIVLF